MFNRAFLEVMLAGDFHGRIFPSHPDLQHHPGFSGSPRSARCCRVGWPSSRAPYFQNFINSI